MTDQMHGSYTASFAQHAEMVDNMLNPQMSSTLSPHRFKAVAVAARALKNTSNQSMLTYCEPASPNGLPLCKECGSSRAACALPLTRPSDRV